MKNSMTITLGENPEFDAVFSGKQPGDKCKFQVEGTVKETDSKSVTVYIDEIEYEGKGEDKEEEHDGSDDPVAMIVEVDE